MKKTILNILVVVSAGAAIWLALNGNKLRPAAKSRIGYVVTTLSNPFFVDMTEGAKAEAAKHPEVELVVQAPEKASDTEGQAQIVENLISQKVQAICIVPADSKGAVRSVKKASAAGIQIINVDNKIDAATLAADGVVAPAFIGSDNRSGGKKAGEFVAKQIGGSGKVAILEGVSGVEAGIKRKEGFLEAIKAFPNISVVASVPADWDREKGLNVFQGILQANPDIKAVFACNDEMALGALRALNKPRTVIVVGFDATKDAIDAIQRGDMDATVAQVPAEMGRMAVQAAVRALKGESNAPVTETELKLVTKQ